MSRDIESSRTRSLRASRPVVFQVEGDQLGIVEGRTNHVQAGRGVHQKVPRAINKATWPLIVPLYAVLHQRGAYFASFAYFAVRVRANLAFGVPVSLRYQLGVCLPCHFKNAHCHYSRVRNKRIKRNKLSTCGPQTSVPPFCRGFPLPLLWQACAATAAPGPCPSWGR